MFQAGQGVVHLLLAGVEGKILAVKKVVEVDHPLLQVEVDGVFLAFRHRRQVEFGALFQGMGELEMKIGGQQGVGQQKAQKQAQDQPGLELPEMAA
jgi:hypothetical protein